MINIIQGDALKTLATLPDESVNCCVTSPPYWGLRDYGCEGQIGMEKTPEDYVSALVAVFGEVRRVLRDDGTLWLNLGDSYASGNTSIASNRHLSCGQKDTIHVSEMTQDIRPIPPGLKPKDLVGIPWRVAFALQSDGWYLRQDIIWFKPNPMPESVTDRCTKAHEYIFLLSKSARYYYDLEAIKEPSNGWNGSRFEDGKNAINHPNVGIKRKLVAERIHGNKPGRDDGGKACNDPSQINRNKRSVWTVPTKPYSEAHFATFPPDLITPCILAGCPIGGTVIDPFGGSGTTGEVAERNGRNSILIELNPCYIELAKKRTQQQGLGL